MNEIDFEQLVEKHRPFLTGLARKLIRNSFVEHYTDSEDLVQETLLRAWAGIGSYEEMDKFRPWLATIMIRRFLTLEGKEKRRGIRCYKNKIWETRALSQESPEKEVLNKINRKQMELAIRRFVPIGSTELIMYILKNKTCREIADELNEPIGTVKTRMRRGRRIFKKVKLFSSLALTT